MVPQTPRYGRGQRYTIKFLELNKMQVGECFTLGGARFPIMLYTISPPVIVGCFRIADVYLQRTCACHIAIGIAHASSAYIYIYLRRYIYYVEKKYPET